MDSFTVANIEGGSIHLLGLGSRYAEFLQMDGRIRAPWELGITGDRVFGYFDGAAASSPSARVRGPGREAEHGCRTVGLRQDGAPIPRMR